MQTEVLVTLCLNCLFIYLFILTPFFSAFSFLLISEQRKMVKLKVTRRQTRQSSITDHLLRDSRPMKKKPTRVVIAIKQEGSNTIREESPGPFVLKVKSDEEQKLPITVQSRF
jgi:hypothetical protein